MQDQNNPMNRSYSICSKIHKESILQREKIGVGKILRNLCEWKGVKIIEAEIYPDHVHMILKYRQNIVYRVL